MAIEAPVVRTDEAKTPMAGYRILFAKEDGASELVLSFIGGFIQLKPLAGADLEQAKVYYQGYKATKERLADSLKKLAPLEANTFRSAFYDNTGVKANHAQP